jgi:hypothetical protein
MFDFLGQYAASLSVVANLITAIVSISVAAMRIDSRTYRRIAICVVSTVGIAGIVAIFYDKHHAAELSKKTEEREAKNGREIGALITSGEQLMNLMTEAPFAPISTQKISDWEKQAEYILSEINESYLPRFRSGSGIIPYIPDLKGISPFQTTPAEWYPGGAHFREYDKLRSRVIRLNEFAGEITGKRPVGKEQLR